MLHVDTSGQGDPIVLVHGFTQTSAAWQPIAMSLAKTNRVIAIDAPGHGKSAAVRADLAGGADLMVAAVDAPAIWIGYSMGARFALHTALQHPDAVTALVLVSGTGGIDDVSERASRRAADETLAQRIEGIGVQAFLNEWLSQPLFATLPRESSALESRLANTAEGLASSLRLAGAATMDPLWGRLTELQMPVLVVAGELDAKYVALAGRLLAAIGSNAALEVIAGAGHACHLEKPRAFLKVVATFVESHGLVEPE